LSFIGLMDFMYYIRQMYYLNVFVFTRKTLSNKKWLFYKFVWRFIKVWKKSQKWHFLLHSFYKKTREIQSDYLCFLNYIRQMYHQNVLCLQVKHSQSKKWLFFKFVWGFIKVGNKSQKQHFFFFIFIKNIREIHPIRSLFIYSGLYKTKYIIQLFCVYKTNNIKVKMSVL